MKVKDIVDHMSENEKYYIFRDTDLVCHWHSWHELINNEAACASVIRNGEEKVREAYKTCGINMIVI